MFHIERTELIVFLMAFCLGLISIGLMEDRPEVIIRWPTPKNAGLVTYLDRASNCYEYESKKVQCTDTAKPVPLEKGEGFSSLTMKDDLRAKKTVNIPSPKWEDRFLPEENIEETKKDA